MNPVGNAYCDKCDARLVPMTTAPASEEEEHKPVPIKGFSLPTIPLEGKEEKIAQATTEDEGEGWLSQLRTSVVEEPEQAEPAVELFEPEEKVEGNWLSQLRASAVEEPEEVEAVDEPLEPVEIPDWLRDMGPVSGEEETPPAPAQDWPTVAEPAGEEPSVAPALAEVPDWLRDAAPEEAAPAVETQPPAPALVDVPDWLRDAAPDEAAPPAVEAEAPALVDVPDWLHDAAPEEAAPPAVEAEPSAPALAEVPDWLQDAAPEEAAPPAVEAQPSAPVLAEIPDWLRDAAPEETAPPAVEEEPSAPVVLAEVPDWLQDMAPEEAAPAVEAKPSAPVLAEVPDWLQDAAPEEAAPAVEAQPPALAEVPDWLQDMAPEETTPAMPEETVSPFVDAPPTAAPDAPEWLAELEPGATLASDTVAPIFEGIAPLEPAESEDVEAAGLVRAEIPAWLEAMRPKDEAAEADAAKGQVETEGLLEGLANVLPLAAAVEMPITREGAPPTKDREASLARAQLLQTLLSRTAETTRPEARKQGVAMSERLQRLVVGVTLLLSVLAILAWRPLLGGEAPLLARPGQLDRAGESLYRAIENVSAGDSVMVAFEYGPDKADELDMVAEPILRHLIERGADISIVSTRPEGLAVAARVWDDTWKVVSDSDLQHYEPNADYRPGDATGVSQLLTGADTRPSMILVLAARPAPLRWWIEQTRARYESALPLAVGMSAAVEAAASPYLDASAGQLQGAISGLSGAAAYENHRGTGGRATERLNALAAGHAAIVILMLAGAVIHTFIRPRGEEW